MTTVLFKFMSRFLPSVAVVLNYSTAHASPSDQPSGLSTSGLVVELALLLIVGACIVTAFKIYVSVRGGSIALGWRWIAGGLGLLGLSQLVLIGQQTGIFAMADLWVNLMRVLSFLLVFIGATRIRKLLI